MNPHQQPDDPSTAATRPDSRGHGPDGGPIDIVTAHDDMLLADPTSDDEIRRRFKALAAAERLARRRRTIFVARLAADGVSAERIAALAHFPVDEIHRILESIPYETLHELPSDVVDARLAGEMSDEQILHRLVTMTYTFDQFPDNGDITVGAYIPGTWHQIERAYQRDELTDAEFDAIFDAHRDEIIHAARQFDVDHPDSSTPAGRAR